MALFDWQVPLAARMKDTLRTGRVFVCGATTGAGKTYLALDVIGGLADDAIDHALVICPKVAISQWHKAASDMDIPVGTILDVINPEQISKPSGCYWFNRDTGWRLPKRTLVVWDEMHRSASGEDSVSTRAAAMLHALPSSKLLAMSATIADSPLKLRAIGFWMGFHNFTKAQFMHWCQVNGCALTRMKGRTIFRFTQNKQKAQWIMKDIRQKMGDRFLSIGPDEIPNFPDEVKEVCYVDLSKTDSAKLKKVYEEMPDSYRKLSQDEMTRLLRCRQQAEFCKAEAIAEMAAAYVDDGYSVFVMVNFTEARLRIEEYLGKKGIRFASIYGGQKDTDRQFGIDAFQRNEIHVVVGMAAACSVAVSLHDVLHERPRVSLLSPGYNAAEFVQGLGRIRRVGGTSATQKIIIAAGSVEERVGRAIDRKLAAIDSLNDNDLAR